MNLPDCLEIGVASHTGQVRSANEDDYLVFVPQQGEELLNRGALLVVADGMGGMTGGGEASRAAVRALASCFHSADISADADDEGLLRSGFVAAGEEVYRLANESPGLREMGTTLTALRLRKNQALIGHVGDSRCLRVRAGVCEALTEDHAVRQADHYLTRCIGAGQQEVEPDLVTTDLQVGDVFVLMTDGVWSTVPKESLLACAQSMSPQLASEEIVRQANERGGPDNATVMIVRLREPMDAIGTSRPIELPAEESRSAPRFDRSPEQLVAPRWPWLLLVLALVLLGLSVVRLWAGRNLLADLWRQLFGG